MTFSHNDLAQYNIKLITQFHFCVANSKKIKLDIEMQLTFSGDFVKVVEFVYEVLVDATSDNRMGKLYTDSEY